MNHICNAVDEKCKDTKCECKEPHQWKAECVGTCLAFCSTGCLDCDKQDDCEYAIRKKENDIDITDEDCPYKNFFAFEKHCKVNDVRFRKCVKTQ